VVNGTVLRFEVDKGAEFSTIPWSSYYPKLNHTSLQQYNGTILPTKEKITVTVCQGQQLLYIRVLYYCRECGPSTSPSRMGLALLIVIGLDNHLWVGEDPRVQTIQSTKRP